MELQELKDSGLAPNWLSQEGIQTLNGGYLLPGETPFHLYKRLANHAEKILGVKGFSDRVFELFWKGWLCPATPVASNFGANRALSISCYSLSVNDSVDGIFKSVHELAMLSKNGGGVAFDLGAVRSRGSAISGNAGSSEGVISWLKIFDVTTVAVSQGALRRGATAAYLPVEHGDVKEFLNIRRPTGDQNRQCLNTHHAVCISDEFMHKVESGDKAARQLWVEILKTRQETGEPYLMFSDTVNRANPECYKANNLKVSASNICSEITLHSDVDHTFVCCLSSMNLTRYDEWKDTDAVEVAIWFLDAVMEDFITRAKGMPGLDRAINFAVKSRALGLGALGWHTYLQEHSIPFESFTAFKLNAQIFKQMHEQSLKATKDLAAAYGEPEWCKGFGIRNTHRLAVAPTVSNSIISGNVSASIEPLPANAYTKKTAKGAFTQQNPVLKRLLEAKGQDTPEVWKSILISDGSVQHLDCLMDHEKEVFKTAREINQLAIINQAAQRQKYIDQAQSVNLFFPANVDPKFFHKVHMEAWKQGLKTLYYCRTGAVLKGDIATRFYDESCKSCEG